MSDLTEPPVFQAAVETVRSATVRSELVLTEIPAPSGLAPSAIAFAADVRPSSHGVDSVLGTGRFILLHDPEVLLIDELSLGLAPVVVQDLLTVVKRLQERGQTIVVVEQSLNVALAIADRAIFLEKGQIRFEGPTAELLERDDLARAVFLERDDD